MSRVDFQFCGVFLFSKRLFVSQEEKVGGPRRMLFPPKEVDAGSSLDWLGCEVDYALSSYRNSGRKIHADEWEALNQQLLDYFDERSISRFERKKKEVTIRRCISTGAVVIFDQKGREVDLNRPTSEEIGKTVKNLLGLK